MTSIRNWHIAQPCGSGSVRVTEIAGTWWVEVDGQPRVPMSSERRANARAAALLALLMPDGACSECGRRIGMVRGRISGHTLPRLWNEPAKACPGSGLRVPSGAGEGEGGHG